MAVRWPAGLRFAGHPESGQPVLEVWADRYGAGEDGCPIG